MSDLFVIQTAQDAVDNAYLQFYPEFDATLPAYHQQNSDAIDKFPGDISQIVWIPPMYEGSIPSRDANMARLRDDVDSAVRNMLDREQAERDAVALAPAPKTVTVDFVTPRVMMTSPAPAPPPDQSAPLTFVAVEDAGASREFVPASANLPDRVGRRVSKGLRINVNTASLFSLIGHPNINATDVPRIIAERRERPFSSPQDFVDRMGKIFEAIKDQILV